MNAFKNLFKPMFLLYKMEKRGVYRDKTGQFYLVAAIIIIIIIFGIFTVRNYARTEKDKTVVYDLEKEFGIESGKIEDFTLYSGQESSQYIDSWIESYVNTRGKSLDDFIVAYGNGTSMTLFNYTKYDSGSVSLGGNTLEMSSHKIERSGVDRDVLNVRLNNITYTFNLEPGKNFIFIIKEGEFVASQE